MTQHQQIQYIIKHALTTPCNAIARNIGRSRPFVLGVLRREGITIPEEVKNKFITDNYFKKGQPIHMTPAGRKRQLQSRIKKGNRPTNTADEYELRIHKSHDTVYYHIKVNTKWIPYHRWIWEQIHGEIPPGYNVQFKDNNTLNTEIENLYMIDRADHAVVVGKRGQTLPYELRQTIILINKLNKSLNEKQNHRPQ